MGIGGTLVTVHIFCHDLSVFGLFAVFILVNLFSCVLFRFPPPVCVCFPAHLCSISQSLPVFLCQFPVPPVSSMFLHYSPWFLVCPHVCISLFFSPWLSFACLCCLPWEFLDFWTLHLSLSSKLAVPMCVSCTWVHFVKKKYIYILLCSILL